tara:strand:- start:227 stop:436 length:210 start_codon:yes stop_codon:yes gene_type:complete
MPKRKPQTGIVKARTGTVIRRGASKPAVKIKAKVKKAPVRITNHGKPTKGRAPQTGMVKRKRKKTLVRK